ncbi:MAG: LysR substrate-binding domain-containing protein [Alphaproteobacteria bacterium]|nr:LysR substrate-binding domain-containing protein [Alphaproteobacteria bacterium]
MKDLLLNALRAFAAVYETGGVRPAARTLEVTHSAISRHLRELEAWVGVALVEKREGARAIAFTPQGEALGRAALAGLRELETAVAAVRESRRGNAVTISTTPSFAARWLLPRLAVFEQAYPWIELSILVDQTLADAADLGAGLAIRMGRGPWPGLVCEPFMDDALYPVMSPAYWEQASRPHKPEDLAGLRLLHDRDPNASWAAWQRRHKAAKLNVRAGPRFTSSDLVLRAAAQGLGVALARHRLAAEDVASGTLMRPCGELHVPVPDAYWILRAETAPARAAVAAVIDWLRSQAASALPPTIVGET